MIDRAPYLLRVACVVVAVPTARAASSMVKAVASGGTEETLPCKKGLGPISCPNPVNDTRNKGPHHTHTGGGSEDGTREGVDGKGQHLAVTGAWSAVCGEYGKDMVHEAGGIRLQDLQRFTHLPSLRVQRPPQRCPPEPLQWRETTDSGAQQWPLCQQSCRTPHAAPPRRPLGHPQAPGCMAGPGASLPHRGDSSTVAARACRTPHGPVRHKKGWPQTPG